MEPHRTIPAPAPPGIVMSLSRNVEPLETASASAERPTSLRGVRLRRHADYQNAYAASRKRQSASMSWFLAPQAVPEGPRVGLTAGKILGKAHERNRIKRRLREALRRHVDLLPAGFDLILHPRRAVLTVEFSQLEAEVVRLLGQAKTLAAQMARNAPAKPTL